MEIFHHDCFTNSIVYTDLVFDIPDLPDEDLPYVRLFAMLLPQMGCGGRSYAENLEYIQGNTGGIGTATPEFHVIGHTKTAPYAALAHNSKPFYGIQFHPEVTHSPTGKAVIGKFILDICGCGKNWTTKSFLGRFISND